MVKLFKKKKSKFLNIKRKKKRDKHQYGQAPNRFKI